jgi:glycosyltransferase involved in cell wall biosynthesis
VSGAAPAQLPITAVVASHNEADELDRCLGSLTFCDEVIVIDIASEDDTARVAEAHGARLVPHEWVPIAEWARIDIVPSARNDWLLFTDPDEEIPAALASRVADFLSTVADDVALVWAPIRFYVGDKPLRGTIWGGENRRRFLVRRDGVELTKASFGGTSMRPGFRMVELPFDAETAIRHRWVDGYGDWIAKHRKYVRLQAVDRAAAGEVTGLRGIASAPWRGFHESYVAKAGYHDGFTGLALSVLWATFVTASDVALYRRLRAQRNGTG